MAVTRSRNDRRPHRSSDQPALVRVGGPLCLRTEQEVLEELHALARAEPDRVERRGPRPQVILEEADPDDPTVGEEHPPGYPRGLWITDDDGSQRWCSYTLIDPDEPTDALALGAKVVREVGIRIQPRPNLQPVGPSIDHSVLHVIPGQRTVRTTFVEPFLERLVNLAALD